MERDQTRTAVERDGRSPPRFRRPYSARRDFGKISSFQGVAASPDSAGRRSLIAAKAANEFTRNCVLDFGRKRATFRRGMIRGFAECFNGTLHTSIHVSLKVLARTSAETWRGVRSFLVFGRAMRLQNKF